MSDDLLALVDEMLNGFFVLTSTLCLLERWTKRYIRNQIEEPQPNEDKYKFDILCGGGGRS